MGKGQKSTVKTIALAVALICLVIPGSYLLLDAVLVNGKIYDLPGGFFTLAVLPSGGEPPAGTLSNKLGFTLLDQLKGGGMSTLHIYLYDGVTLVEDLTTASTGYIATAGYYAEGKSLNIKIDTGNSEIWKIITVPKHSQAMIEGGLATPITLYGTVGPTVTDALQDQAGTAIADAGTYNVTLVSTTFNPTYSFFVGTDDTGILSSARDPVYGMTPQVVLVLELSANNYAQINPVGFDGKITEGAKNIFYKVIDVADISKDKSGTVYINGMDGSDGFSFACDLTGISFASAVTGQLYIYSEGDPVYRQNHSTWGPDQTELCESSFTIIQ
jgi:hypothetical protein